MLASIWFIQQLDAVPGKWRARQNSQPLFWLLSCRQRWHRSQRAFQTMAWLQRPVLRSSCSNYGSSCSTPRPSFSQPQRSWKPCVPNRLKKWRRWALTPLLKFNSKPLDDLEDVLMTFMSFSVLGGKLCCAYSWASSGTWRSDGWIWKRQRALAPRASPDQATTRLILYDLVKVLGLLCIFWHTLIPC